MSDDEWPPKSALPEVGSERRRGWSARKPPPISARCPKCGAKMPAPESAKATTRCPQCETLWKHKSGVKGVLGEFEEAKEVFEPGEVDLTEKEAEEKWKREHQ